MFELLANILIFDPKSWSTQKKYQILHNISENLNKLEIYTDWRNKLASIFFVFDNWSLTTGALAVNDPRNSTRMQIVVRSFTKTNTDVSEQLVLIRPKKEEKCSDIGEILDGEERKKKLEVCEQHKNDPNFG